MPRQTAAEQFQSARHHIHQYGSPCLHYLTHQQKAGFHIMHMGMSCCSRLVFISPAEGWMLSNKRGNRALCTASEVCFWAKDICKAAPLSLCNIFQQEMHRGVHAACCNCCCWDTSSCCNNHDLRLTINSCSRQRHASTYTHTNNELDIFSSAYVPDLQQCLISAKDLEAAPAHTHIHKALPGSYTSLTWRAISFCCFSQAAHCCPIFSSFVLTYSV